MVHTVLRKGEQLIASLYLQVKLPLNKEWMQAHWQLLRRLCMSSIKQQTLRTGIVQAGAQAPSLAVKEAAEQHMHRASAQAAKWHSMIQRHPIRTRPSKCPRYLLPCLALMIDDTTRSLRWWFIIVKIETRFRYKKYALQGRAQAALPYLRAVS